MVRLEIGHRQPPCSLELTAIVPVSFRRLLRIPNTVHISAIDMEPVIERLTPLVSIIVDPHQVVVECLNAFVSPPLALARAHCFAIDTSVFNKTFLFKREYNRQKNETKMNKPRQTHLQAYDSSLHP